MQLILAHGAGAPMDSDFMQSFARGLAARGVRVIRFEFPYMQQRREDGRKRPPNRAPVLQSCWLDVVAAHPAERTFIGGKSMGGRIATVVAERTPALGVICLGYPFHPPGKPAKLRIDHLRASRVPALIVQGSRDALGSQEEVLGYDLPEQIRLVWLADGDHSLKPRKRSGHSQAAHLARAVEASAAFMTEISGPTQQ